jgi:hypothetical protein
MAKGKKSMKKFKKAIEVSITSMQEMFKKRNNNDGALILAKKGDCGVTFIEGSHECIKIILKESCVRDKGFAKILLDVANNITEASFKESGDDENNMLKKMLKESGVELPENAIAIDLGSMGDPSDEQIDDFVNKMLKDLHDKRNGNKE